MIVRLTRALALAIALGATFLPSSPASAALVAIINADTTGEGLNDPTPVAPVGGNPGTTLGEQRYNVLRAAADIWASTLSSPIEIRVRASFDPLPCDIDDAVLGAGSPTNLFTGFDGAPLPDAWYQSALANRLTSRDIRPAEDDLVIRLNRDLENAGCLGSIGWYYGLDGNTGNDANLLRVVIHELAHGLGFSTFVDLDTGELLDGRRDVYSHFILDTSSGLHWDQMNDTQRFNSAINTGNVVWDGAAVTTHAADFLEKPRLVRIDSPPAIEGDIEFGEAQFGPTLSSPGITAEVALADDGVGTTSDACEPLINGAALAGRIALIDRGTCNFTDKVLAAQIAGAVAVAIVNNTSFPPIDMVGDEPAVVIPSVMISQSEGSLIRSRLGSETVVMTLTVDDAQPLSGTDAAGRVLLYAPDEALNGVSITHWDDTATPDLLMEPFEGAGEGTLDLTTSLFADIGWFNPLATNPIALATALPNPFATSCTVRFEATTAGDLDISIYDLGGRLVRRLVHGPINPGTGDATWDGTDMEGRRMRQGVYLCRLKLAGHSESKRMVLVE